MVKAIHLTVGDIVRLADAAWHVVGTERCHEPGQHRVRLHRAGAPRPRWYQFPAHETFEVAPALATETGKD